MTELLKAQTAKQTQVASQSNSENRWSELELQLLVKATTLFPIGTASRWEVIADYINEHGQNQGNEKTGKQVINKVKNLKKQGLLISVSKKLINRYPRDWCPFFLSEAF